MEPLSWHTPEYIHTEKTNDWYWIVGIIAVSAAAIAIILNDLVFGILIIVSAFTLVLYASRPPHIVEVTVAGNGIRVDRTLYPYSHLESFWVETSDLYPRLILKSNRKLVPHIVILIEDVSPEEVKQALEHRLPEVHQTEPFFEKLLLYLGF